VGRRLPGGGVMDRFSVCEGYWLYYSHWHKGGITTRCLRQGREIARQLSRMGFNPAPLLTLRSLADDEREGAREVYLELVRKHEGHVHAELDAAWLEGKL